MQTICIHFYSLSSLTASTTATHDHNRPTALSIYFVAVILKVLIINLLAALNFANVFKNKKRLQNKKR